MSNLKKYRQYSIRAAIAFGVFFVLSLSALWNSLMTAPVKNEGWAVAFLILLAAAGVMLFFLAFRAADESVLETEKTAAFEAGRNEVLAEIARRDRAEHSEEAAAQEDIDKLVMQIIEDIGSGSGKTSDRILASLAKHMGFLQGILYLGELQSARYTPDGEYALTGHAPQGFTKGEGLAGQVAENLAPMVLYDVPEHYFPVSSALGSARPHFLVFLPVVTEGACTAVIELAAFKRPDNNDLKIMQQLTTALGKLVKPTVAA